MIEPTKVPLSATEEAFTKMVSDEFIARVRSAEAARDQRMAVLLGEKGIPFGVAVSVEPRTAGGPAHLVYEAP